MQPDAAVAIGRLEAVRSQVPIDHFAYVTSPNCILSLSGARPLLDEWYRPGDERQAAKWRRELTKLLGALTTAGDVYFSQVETGKTAPLDGQPEQYVSFAVVLRPELEAALEATCLLHKEEARLPAKPSHKNAVEAAIGNALKSVPAFVECEQEEIDYIARGILFGYPDVAIASSLRADRDALVFAKINGSDYYDCPQPLCMYPREMAFEPAIKAHQTLWAGILETYYTSQFHGQLEQDIRYRAKLVELGMI